MNRTIQGKIFFTIFNRPWVRVLVLGGIYSVVLSVCLWLAYELRFDFDVPDRFEPNLVEITLLVLAIKLAPRRRAGIGLRPGENAVFPTVSHHAASRVKPLRRIVGGQFEAELVSERSRICALQQGRVKHLPIVFRPWLIII